MSTTLHFTGYDKEQIDVQLSDEECLMLEEYYSKFYDAIQPIMDNVEDKKFAAKEMAKVKIVGPDNPGKFNHAMYDKFNEIAFHGGNLRSVTLEDPGRQAHITQYGMGCGEYADMDSGDFYDMMS